MKQIHPINQVKKWNLEKYIVTNCKKVLGRYNVKFYNDDKVRELLNTTHSSHIRNGHRINIRKVVED